MASSGSSRAQRIIRRHRLRAMLTATVRSQASGLSASLKVLRWEAARAKASITTSSASVGSPVTPVSCPTRRAYDAAYTSRSRPSSTATPLSILLLTVRPLGTAPGCIEEWMAG